MAKKATKKSLNDNDLKLALERSQNFHVTLRWSVVALATCAGIYFITDALKVIFGKDQNWTTQVFLVIGGLLVGTSAPAIGLRLVWQKLRVHIWRDASQKSDIQGIVDRTRTSSGVGLDGRHNDD